VVSLRAAEARLYAARQVRYHRFLIGEKAMSFNSLVDNLRSFSWKEWALVAMVVVVFAAMFGTVGLTMGPLVGYLMVLGLRRAKANRQARARIAR